MRLVEVSANTGKVLRILGENFKTDTQIVEFVHGYLGLSEPDLDQPLIWQHPSRDTLIVVEV